MTQRLKAIIVCPLFNFKLDEESEKEFQISDQIKLRKIKNDVLLKMKKAPYIYILGRSHAYLNSQTFVFEINHGDFIEASRRVYEVLLAMRLFKTGAVFCKHFWVEQNSEQRQFYAINPPIPRHNGDYLLNVDEIDEIKLLLKKISHIELEKNKSFRVACERFSRSFEERREDDKIIDLAIAFESLFTDKKTSRSNVMGQLIGLGCSMLIGTNQKDRDKIKNFLKKAFSIRNDIVHSSEVKTPIQINNKKYKMNEFALELQEYLRASIKKLI